ncbi:DNA replication and repair protein RadC [Trichlorobacter thiogenes]|uniref:DNA replication and repair protein RadC n=1 Tax=Trichlorobacter thiogenes TaxID=115783 RepID=A0A1T4MJX4_9BACT|nr:DNA repair protein RadC [Trichlorobacter thiogenes]SJZ67054.1 DNA replication and repair protein RadC [Trichlorobacter thiogenes]
MSSNAIKDWPEDERPREKLLKRGAAALSDAELLALVLRTGDAAAGKSAIDLGRELLERCNGNLRELAQAELNELQQIKGLGLAKAASIKAAFTLGSRFQARKLETLERFTAPAQVFDFFHHELRDNRKELFLILLLDGKNRITRKVQISEGCLNQSIVHPREVFAPAVRESAAAVIFIHNHPSGDPAPSREDREITRRLKEGGEILGIKVLDHIIIGDGSYFSFVESGLL